MANLDVQKFTDLAKQQGFSEQQVQQFLGNTEVQGFLKQNNVALKQAPSPLVTGNENILTKLGTVFGLKPLGESIGRGIFRFMKESKDLNQMVQQGQVESRESVLGQAPTPLQVGASTANLGLLLGGGSLLKAGTAAATRGVSQLGLGGAAARIAGSTIGGAELGALSGGAQSLALGRSAKEAIGDTITGAAVGGVVSGGLTATGEALTWFTTKLPERLRTPIYRDAEKDAKEYLESVAKGKKVNPTLARESLNERVFGTLEGQYKYSTGKLNDFERQLQNTLKDKRITVTNKKSYIKLLKEVKGQFGTEFSDTGKAADGLITQLKGYKTQKLPAPVVLKLRRFVDGVRKTSSFNANSILNPKQEMYKNAANQLRTMVAKQGNAGSLINKERMYIGFRDSILDEYVRRNNKAVINLQDIILGGGGTAVGGPFGGAIGAGSVRIFQTPTVATGLGQALFELGKIAPKAGKTANVAKALSVLGASKSPIQGD